jgi:transposase
MGYFAISIADCPLVTCFGMKACTARRGCYVLSLSLSLIELDVPRSASKTLSIRRQRRRMVARCSDLTLMTEAAPQRDYPLRELFNALRYVIRYGIAWRAMPHDLPPWAAVYQQSQRWLAAGCFDSLPQDLRALLRLAFGRAEEPTAAIIDSRTLRSTPESGTRAGYDGAKRKRGSKVHMAVDTLGHLLALHVTPADVGDRAAVGRLAADIQDATRDRVRLAYVDQGYTGEAAADAASAEGITLHVVKLPEAKRGFVLLPRRWVVERSFRLGDALPPVGQGLRALLQHSLASM